MKFFSTECREAARRRLYKKGLAVFENPMARSRYGSLRIRPVGAMGSIRGVNQSKIGRGLRAKLLRGSHLSIVCLISATRKTREIPPARVRGYREQTARLDVPLGALTALV
jgi:hypothetical protein